MPAKHAGVSTGSLGCDQKSAPEEPGGGLPRLHPGYVLKMGFSRDSS